MVPIGVFQEKSAFRAATMAGLRVGSIANAIVTVGCTPAIGNNFVLQSFHFCSSIIDPYEVIEKGGNNAISPESVSVEDFPFVKTSSIVRFHCLIQANPTLRLSNISKVEFVDVPKNCLKFEPWGQEGGAEAVAWSYGHISVDSMFNRRGTIIAQVL